MPKWELKCITQRNNIICWHHKSRASQKSSIPAQQIQRTGARKRACRGETGRSVSTKHEHVHSRTQQHRVHTQPSHTISPASCRNPASRHNRWSAQEHARAGLQERNGPKPTRRARAHRPATSQRRVGRRRRGGGAPWFCERASGHVPATGAPMSLLFTGKKRSLGVLSFNHELLSSLALGVE